MSPLPIHMIDRWEKRIDPGPGQEVLYWHILLKDYPDVQAAVAMGRERLASFRGLHFTPTEWLHITTYVAGSTNMRRLIDIDQMTRSAKHLLSGIEPISVSMGRILYHPEAIAIKVNPSHALDRVRQAVQLASLQGGTGDALGNDDAWSPHVTLAYSTSFQEASPIIDALGDSVPECEITIDHISLVAQKGPERSWNWHPISRIPLGPR